MSRACVLKYLHAYAGAPMCACIFPGTRDRVQTHAREDTTTHAHKHTHTHTHTHTLTHSLSLSLSLSLSISLTHTHRLTTSQVVAFYHMPVAVSHEQVESSGFKQIYSFGGSILWHADICYIVFLSVFLSAVQCSYLLYCVPRVAPCSSGPCASPPATPAQSLPQTSAHGGGA